jgi:hypothetical protein
MVMVDFMAMMEDVDGRFWWRAELVHHMAMEVKIWWAMDFI